MKTTNWKDVVTALIVAVAAIAMVGMTLWYRIATEKVAPQACPLMTKVA